MVNHNVKMLEVGLDSMRFSELCKAIAGIIVNELG